MRILRNCAMHFPILLSLILALAAILQVRDHLYTIVRETPIPATMITDFRERIVNHAEHFDRRINSRSGMKYGSYYFGSSVTAIRLFQGAIAHILLFVGTICIMGRGVAFRVTHRV